MAHACFYTISEQMPLWLYSTILGLHAFPLICMPNIKRLVLLTVVK